LHERTYGDPLGMVMAPQVPPFNVTQGHQNLPGLISHLGLPHRTSSL